MRCRPERDSRGFRNSRATTSRSSRPRRRNSQAAISTSSCSDVRVASRFMTRERLVMDIVAVPPAPDGLGGDAILAGQLAIREAGGYRLDLGPELRCRRGLLIHLDVHEPAPE